MFQDGEESAEGIGTRDCLARCRETRRPRRTTKVDALAESYKVYAQNSAPKSANSFTLQKTPSQDDRDPYVATILDFANYASYVYAAPDF